MAVSSLPVLKDQPELTRYLLERDRGGPAGTVQPGSVTEAAIGTAFRKVKLDWSYSILPAQESRRADFFLIGSRCGVVIPVGEASESVHLAPGFARTHALLLPAAVAFQFAITPARFTHGGGLELGTRVEPAAWRVSVASDPALRHRLSFLEAPNGSRVAFTPSAAVAIDSDGFLKGDLWRQQLLPNQTRTNPPPMGQWYWSGTQVVLNAAEPPRTGESVYLLHVTLG